MARLIKSAKKKTISKKRSTHPKVVKESRAEYMALPERQVILTEHPHIVCIPGVQSGAPIIREAVVTVHHMVILTHRFGQTPEQIVKEWQPHLSLAQIYDALSYYYDHQQDIDDIIAIEDRIEAKAIQRFRSKQSKSKRKT